MNDLKKGQKLAEGPEEWAEVAELEVGLKPGAGP